MWDPSKRRAQEEGNLGYRSYFLRHDFLSTQKKDALGAVGSSATGDAVYCYLCGLDEPARQLLVMAHEYLTVAVDTNEPDRLKAGGAEAAHGKRALLYSNLSMCRWLLDSQHDEESLAAMMFHSKKHHAFWRRRTGSESLNLELPDFLNAGDYDYVCEFFEKNSKKTAPEKLKSIKSPGVMACVLAKHKQGQYSDEEVSKVLKRFLERNMDEQWLERGHANTAALWMKIVYWNDTDRQLPALDVVMKCYDHLPGREPLSNN